MALTPVGAVQLPAVAQDKICVLETTMPLCVPVMVALAVSVTVMDRVPPELNVTPLEKMWVPASPLLKA